MNYKPQNLIWSAWFVIILAVTAICSGAEISIAREYIELPRKETCFIVPTPWLSNKVEELMRFSAMFVQVEEAESESFIIQLIKTGAKEYSLALFKFQGWDTAYYTFNEVQTKSNPRVVKVIDEQAANDIYRLFVGELLQAKYGWNTLSTGPGYPYYVIAASSVNTGLMVAYKDKLVEGTSSGRLIVLSRNLRAGMLRGDGQELISALRRIHEAVAECPDKESKP